MDDGCGAREKASDQELLCGAASDASALGSLYVRYAKLVYGIALAILRVPEDAEDVTHEVFLCVCQPVSYDAARGAVSSFLIAMTRSRAIDRLRARDRRLRLLRAWTEGELPEPGEPSPLEALSLRRSAEQVRAALEKLPRCQRKVLVRSYFDGLSQREVAADLGASLGAVKSRSRRGLAALNQSLDRGKGASH